MSKPAPIECPADMTGKLWTTKDLARFMGLHVNRVKHWWKTLKVPPDMCEGNALHRWSWRAVKRLLTRWRKHWQGRGATPEAGTEKFAGKVKAAREQRQLKLPLTW